MTFNPETDCSDCGGRPKHKRSRSGYCRQCDDKNNGGDYNFTAKIDLDIAELILGGSDELEAFLSACRVRA